MTTPVRAAILARVSTDEQHIDTQLIEMREKARLDGAEIVCEYPDDGVSGATGNLARRHGLKRMIADINERPVPWTVLYVYTFDRFIRSDEPEEQAAIIGPLKRAGVIVKTRTGEQHSFVTSFGRAIGGMQFDSAAEWLKLHTQRILDGKKTRIRDGGKPAGPTPYGLRYQRPLPGVPMRWWIDDAEGAIIREIFTRVADGVSCYRIAADLEDRHVPTKRGGLWSRERVWKLVREATYRGEWTADKRKRLTVPVPAIVTDSEWYAAQAALDAYGKRGMKRTKHVYLLEDVGRCELCGGLVCVSSGCVPRNRPAYYVCHGRLRAARGAVRCALPMLRVKDTDARVWEALRDALATPGNLEAAIDERKRQLSLDTRDVGADLVEWRGKLKRATGTEHKLVDRFRRGMISEAALDAALDAGRKERAMLTMQIAACERITSTSRRDGADADAVLATVATLRSRLDAATPAARRAIVGAVVTGIGDNHVTIGPKNITIHGIVAAGPSVALERAADFNCARQRNEGFTVGLRIVA